MFCRQCGSELDGKSKFCSKCGTSTRTDADYKSNSSQSNMQTREELVDGFKM